jgi:curli biogenesis system outer membrane secretion channel CsgG
MKTRHSIVVAAAALVSLSACVQERAPVTGLPQVRSATDITSFQGARAGQSEMGIQALGYEAVRTEGLTTYWLNRGTGACARIVTSDGRYASVVMVPTSSC